jgi:CheY-like chemotaxis protein
MEAKQQVILSVDDNDVDGALLRRAVKRSAIPASIFTVTEGPQALSYLAGEGIYQDRESYPYPDLVLLDIRMPKMSGLDVLSWIRQQPHLKKTKVLILSASDKPEDIKRANSIGADDYLVKPTKFDELQTMVKTIFNTWLDKSRKSKGKEALDSRASAPASGNGPALPGPMPARGQEVSRLEPASDVVSN